MSDKPIIIDGIKVNVTEDVLDDIEILELMEANKLVAAMKLIFGEKKYAEIKEKLRDPETGKTRATALGEWFQKFSEKMNAKN